VAAAVATRRRVGGFPAFQLLSFKVIEPVFVEPVDIGG
jgi:hypothetical protein